MPGFSFIVKLLRVNIQPALEVCFINNQSLFRCILTCLHLISNHIHLSMVGMSPKCDHSPSAGASGPSWIYLMGPASQITWKRQARQISLFHDLGYGRIFDYWSDSFIYIYNIRYFGLIYSIWLDFCLSSCFVVLKMPWMPSWGKDAGNMSMSPELPCQHPHACGSGEDTCSNSHSLGGAEPMSNTWRDKSPVPSFEMSFVQTRGHKGKYPW